MADNITNPAAVGTVISTDQLGTGEHVQYMKLMSGTADATEKIPGTAANGLLVDVSRIQGTNTIVSPLETSSIYNGTTALTPKFAAIAASTSGNNTIVAAVTSKKIRVLAYNFMGAGTVNAKFQSGAGGTDLTGLKYLVANTGIVAPFNPVGWFETAAGTLLNLNLSAAIAVGGEIVYIEV